MVCTLVSVPIIASAAIFIWFFTDERNNGIAQWPIRYDM